MYLNLMEGLKMKVKIIYNTGKKDEFICHTVNHDVVRGFTIIVKLVDDKLWEHLIPNGRILDMQIDGDYNESAGINKMYEGNVVNTYPHPYQNHIRTCRVCKIAKRQNDMFCEYDGFSLNTSRWYCEKCYIEKHKND